jgi:hypothetical protein
VYSDRTGFGIANYGEVQNVCVFVVRLSPGSVSPRAKTTLDLLQREEVWMASSRQPHSGTSKPNLMKTQTFLHFAVKAKESHKEVEYTFCDGIM